METPYLIQRASFESRDRKGIDGILCLDYMGSAEFELDALPASLKRIRAAVEQYIYFTWTYQFAPEKPITVFCRSQDQNEVKNILIQLTRGEIRLKERCDLKDYINPGIFPYQKSDFWWDIENDFMFWKQNEDFEIELKKVIK